MRGGFRSEGRSDVRRGVMMGGEKVCDDVREYVTCCESESVSHVMRVRVCHVVRVRVCHML